MLTQAQYERGDEQPTHDHIIRFSGVTWEDYQRLLAMRGERFVPIETSEVLPELDLALLSRFLDRPTTSEAMRAYRDALRAAPEA